MSGNKKVLVKIIIIGESGVGKTVLLHQYVTGNFIQEHKSTTGADFHTSELNIENKTITLQICDTAGQERFQSLGNAFYRGADACILVYDITEENSFKQIDDWKTKFISQAGIDSPRQYPFLLLANKIDLQNRVISQQQGQSYATENNMLFYETSALNDTNIEEAIEKIASIASDQPTVPLKWQQHWRANPTNGTTFFLKRIWYLSNLNIGLSAYIYYLKHYRTDLPLFQTKSLIIAASGYVIREFVSFLYTSPSKCIQNKDLFLVVVGNIIYFLPAYFARSSKLFSERTNKIINYASLILSIAGHVFNSYAEMQRKWWCEKTENKGKVYTDGLFSITRHPNYFGDILFITGWHLLSRHWVPLLLAPMQIYSFYTEYIPEIESFMEQKHGKEWTDYVDEVKSSLIPLLPV